VQFILAIGGIEVRTGQTLGRDITLSSLRRDYDAVFLGLGFAGVNALHLENEHLSGVEDAVAFIARLRQAPDRSVLPMGRRVVVIGGGNTAIDAAVQSRRLGAEEVTIVYRRGAEQMTATRLEQEFAQVNGVTIRHWAQPFKLRAKGGRLAAVEFERTRLGHSGHLSGTGEHFVLSADMVFKAIGQLLLPDPISEDGRLLLRMAGGAIDVDAEQGTSLPGVYAGGGCAAGGHDLTVQAVEDGKRAAEAIGRYLGRTLEASGGRSHG
jgi:glutamate synthase (NADPH/NADH) small chain